MKNLFNSSASDYTSFRILEIFKQKLSIYSFQPPLCTAMFATAHLVRTATTQDRQNAIQHWHSKPWIMFSHIHGWMKRRYKQPVRHIVVWMTLYQLVSSQSNFASIIFKYFYYMFHIFFIRQWQPVISRLLLQLFGHVPIHASCRVPISHVWVVQLEQL